MRLADLRVMEGTLGTRRGRPATVADLIAALKEKGAEVVDISHPDVVMGQYRIYLDEPWYDDMGHNRELEPGRYLVYRIDEDE